MKSNNLNALRLIAAGLVLYGHSFVFLGLHEPRFLSSFLFGELGVFIFFIVSGFLVTQSWDRDPQLLRFFARRALRIFPGLIVCIFLSVVVLGPLLTTLSLDDYYAHPVTLGYFENIWLLITYYLPGVFETNRIANAVNGSLWSLPVEFFMYIVVSATGLISGRRWVVALLFLGSALLSYFWTRLTTQTLVVYQTDVRQVFFCGAYFWAGAVYYRFKFDRFFSLSATLAACVLMLCLEPYPDLLKIASWGALPFVVLAFGLSDSPVLSRLLGKNDVSYGVYIYAFPIQQAVVYLYPTILLVPYLAICCGLTLVLAYISWHAIESRALKLKPTSPHRHSR